MLTKLGIVSLLAGFVLGVLSGISGFMEKQTVWADLTLSKLLGEDRAASVITVIDAAAFQNAMDMLIYEVPVFLLLIFLGMFLLLVALFVKNH